MLEVNEWMNEWISHWVGEWIRWMYYSQQRKKGVKKFGLYEQSMRVNKRLGIVIYRSTTTELIICSVRLTGWLVGCFMMMVVALSLFFHAYLYIYPLLSLSSSLRFVRVKISDNEIPIWNSPNYFSNERKSVCVRVRVSEWKKKLKLHTISLPFFHSFVSTRVFFSFYMLLVSRKC